MEEGLQHPQRHAVRLPHGCCSGEWGIRRYFFVHSVVALRHVRDPACASGRPQALLWTVLGLAIPRLLGLGFVCKRNDRCRIHAREAGTVGQVINLALYV